MQKVVIYINQALRDFVTDDVSKIYVYICVCVCVCVFLF